MTNKHSEQKIDRMDKSIQRIEKTVDNLAIATARGFTEQKKYMDQRFDRLEKKMDKLEKELKSIKADLEELKLKFNNVTYRFELNALAKRVEILERKIKSA